MLTHWESFQGSKPAATIELAPLIPNGGGISTDQLGIFPKGNTSPFPRKMHTVTAAPPCLHQFPTLMQFQHIDPLRIFFYTGNSSPLSPGVSQLQHITLPSLNSCLTYVEFQYTGPFGDFSPEKLKSLSIGSIHNTLPSLYQFPTLVGFWCIFALATFHHHRICNMHNSMARQDFSFSPHLTDHCNLLQLTLPWRKQHRSLPALLSTTMASSNWS